MISFLDDSAIESSITSVPSNCSVDSLRLDGLHFDPLGALLMGDVTAKAVSSSTTAHAQAHISTSTGGAVGGGNGGDSKNKNSSLRGTLQTSSTPTKTDSSDRIAHDRSNNDPQKDLQKEGTLAPEIPDRKNSPPPSNGQAGHRRILSKREPLVCVERDSSHFDVLPRLPLTKLLLVRAGPKTQQISGQTKNDTATSTSSTASSSPGALQKNNSNNNNNINNSSGNVPRFPSTNPPKPTQASSLYGLEQAASLVIFSRNGRLALSAGRVDGSVAVREVDPRTGFILSAADFHAHHHRVICLACDSIAFARTDVIASCDAYGQTLVWTVSRLKVPSQPSGVSSHVISRRPQRLFRCEASQHMKCEISWQLGLVVTVSVGVVHIFSVERDERLRAFEYDWEEDLIEDDAEKEIKEKAVMVRKSDEDKVVIVDIASVTHTESSTESESSSEEIPDEFEVNKKDFYSSDKTNTTGLSSTYRKRTVHKKSVKDMDEDGQCKDMEEECSIARRIALCDDGSVLLHVEVTSAREEAQSTSPLPPPPHLTPSTSSQPPLPPRKSEPRRTSVHYILSYSLSGVRTGRARMVSPVTFLSVPDRSSDIAIAGCEDGAVTIFRFVG